ncbi:hypothetical protein OB905_04225 [Halobacteria archaeon AArc-dxtr1]|nr:hypothetical protein [Halobacteria archaeon AArc-dxtr1]
MTVVLAGVGADSTNLGALGRLDDGVFDYIPIPEKTQRTTESATLGSWPLRTEDGVAADLTSRITPQPIHDGETAVTGSALADWPFHRDPNFEALSYGEHRTSGYVSRLRTLEPGDAVGFYVGLRDPAGRAHRYLIGYFTVDAVDVIEPETSIDERRAILDRHAENAHAKRAVDGDRYHAEKTVVLVDGREPGGLFDRDPIRLSEYRTKAGNVRPQYYLRDEVADTFSVVEGGANMMYKPAYRCAIDGGEFRDLVDSQRSRRQFSGRS